MKEYIERDKVLSHKWEVRSYDPSDPDPVTEVVSVSSIMCIPAADVVEVVRCGECIYWEPASPTRTSGNCNRSFDIPAWATDFCSYGERKGGGQGE